MVNIRNIQIIKVETQTQWV